MSRANDEVEAMDSPPVKRKRDVEEDLEIDLNLPEPPSKKAKRKAKKSHNSVPTAPASTEPSADLDRTIDGNQTSAGQANPSHAAKANLTSESTAKRSEHGIWIGNLPFTATKETVRDFLREQGGMEESDVTRVHLPTTNVKDSRGTAQNKGFAYVDFTSKEIMEIAMGLSERLFSGRRVLIKNAKSFEGRPEKSEEQKTPASSNKAAAKEPTTKVFVGNLGFDVTREDLMEHFNKAGPVEDIFMATFEDSGKCKGFAWVRFATLEASEAAVKGYIYKNADSDDESEEEADGVTEVKKRKRQKYFINRLHGRQLRCEFAEDAQTRYKKRFGKDSKPQKPDEIVEVDGAASHVNGDADTRSKSRATSGRHEQSRMRPADARPDKEQRREDRRKRHEKLDARTIAPGRALANTQRASGAIVAGQGKKMVFDD